MRLKGDKLFCECGYGSTVQTRQTDASGPHSIGFTAESGRHLARRFHEAYERLAPQFGYETRGDTRAFDPDSPNGRLMIAVCDEVFTDSGTQK